MTDHSTARALVEELRACRIKCSNGHPESDWVDARKVTPAFLDSIADFIEQTLTPPEGDTLSGEVYANIAAARLELSEIRNPPLQVRDAIKRLADSIAALQSRVSPQEGLREALEECRLIVANLPHGEELLLTKIDAALSASRISEDATK